MVMENGKWKMEEVLVLGLRDMEYKQVEYKRPIGHGETKGSP